MRTQFELYEFGDPDPPEAFDAERAITGIWISRQHLGDHTLSESTGKIMERWVHGELPFDRLLGIPPDSHKETNPQTSQTEEVPTSLRYATTSHS